MEFVTPQDGLRRSRLAGPLKGLYRKLGCGRRWRLGRVMIDTIQRREGGHMFTQTCRELLEQYHGVKIGAYSYGPCFEPGIFPEQVEIGRYTSIGPGVRVFNQNHLMDHLSTHPFFYEGEHAADLDMPRNTTRIGSDVWLGCNALVTPGCQRIGDGAVIGAGAVVTKDVPDFAIVAGVPAKVIKFRFSEEVMAQVAESCWWERSYDEVREHGKLFVQQITEEHLTHPLLRTAADKSDRV
ncbi:MAG: CatB-related O-acetyltransferase [Planctomycetota bacterium]